MKLATQNYQTGQKQRILKSFSSIWSKELEHEHELTIQVNKANAELNELKQRQIQNQDLNSQIEKSEMGCSSQ